MNKLTTIFFSILTITICFGQTSSDSTKKNYCGWTGCTLKPDDPIHFDPYYNGHLCENFNPQQIDFSKEYFELRTKLYAKDTEQLKQSLKYDYSSIWLSGKWAQDGVIGLNYQRIKFHIDKVTKSKNKSNTYLIIGKSKVNDNICNFSGELNLLKFFITECEDTLMKKCGELFCSYVFNEDSSQNHSGVFRGVMECSIYIDSTGTKMLLDETSDIADGYFNRTFIGTWTNYKTKQAKKCIWGDYHLPFTFDFNCGDGEFHPCDKYKMNGWQSFNDGSELIEVSNDKFELKDKWWLKK